MGVVVLPFTLQAGANENINDLNGNLNAILAQVNGNIDATNILNASVTGDKFTTTVAQQLGLTNVANVGRGKSIIATTESRTNVAYGTLTTPDQVTGIVLPTDGLIAVAYQAVWQESVNGAGRACVFVGANNIVKASGNGAPSAAEAAIASGVAAVDNPLASFFSGLISGNYGAAYNGDVTSGQTVGAVRASVDAGGPMWLFAAAGTYTVSVQFKASSGSVTAKNRKLWIWTVGF